MYTHLANEVVREDERRGQTKARDWKCIIEGGLRTAQVDRLCTGMVKNMDPGLRELAQKWGPLFQDICTFNTFKNHGLLGLSSNKPYVLVCARFRRGGGGAVFAVFTRWPLAAGRTRIPHLKCSGKCGQERQCSGFQELKE